MPLWLLIIFVVINLIFLILLVLVQKNVRHVIRGQIRLLGRENRRVVMPFAFILIRFLYFSVMVALSLFSYFLLLSY